MTPAAALDLIQSWPDLPRGAYVGDYPDDGARARGEAVWDSIRDNQLSIYDEFAISSTRLSAEQWVPVGTVKCLRTVH